MKSPFRTSGWAAILSGVVGIIAIASLIAYLILRSSDMAASILMNKFHDVAVSIQFLLLISVVVGLQKWSQHKLPGITHNEPSHWHTIHLLCYYFFIAHHT